MIRSHWLVVVCLVAGFSSNAAWSSSRAPEMRVQGSTERLPLMMTRVDADIAGVIADVKLTQVYQNRGSEPIEAVYVFPVTRQAAVYALSLRVGDRVVRADLQTREQAQKRYEEARESGRTATLLEQRDADVVQLSVANILPGDDIEVELRYSELLVPEAGRYRFFFPNTFGDTRYGGEASEAASITLTSDAEALTYALDVNLRLATPVPIRAIESPSHPVLIERPSPYEAEVQLSDTDPRAAARDFVVDFRLAGDSVETGLLVHSEGDEGWFLLMAEPPATVRQSAVVPREYLFVLDVSGSMRGNPIDTAKALMHELVGGLRSHERFNLLLFESRVKALTLGPSLPPGPDNLKRAIHAIDSQFGHGGTHLVLALEDAYALPHTPGYSRTLVVVTDGHIHAGPEASALISSNLHLANVFVMGIGPSVSDQVIERLARAGRGEAILVRSEQEAPQQAERLRRMVDRPLLTDIRLDFEGIDAFDLEPAQVPDVFAERPIVVTGRFQGAPGGRVSLSGRNADGAYRQTLEFDQLHSRRPQPVIKRLWARERLTSWMDGRLDGKAVHQVEGRVEEATAHALRYGLLSPWTSFVAVHEAIRTDGSVERVAQPAARRDTFVGGGVGMVPPPRVAMADASTALQSVSGVRLEAPVPAAQRWLEYASVPDAAPAPPVPGVSALGPADGDRMQLAGHDFVWQKRRWESVQWREDMTMLRIQRGSEAATRLLAMRPELAPLFDLFEPVLIVLNDHAVLIGPLGFSDYPEEVLAKLAPRD
ncbi:MAG TPA: VIT domain-containing protein [Xanthomonadaceae bacterium]|nr:VIT domain-containing protein [Xanthomonadaceae bacterium]